MSKGTVKWFSNQKGYGFITPEEGSASGKDIFVHYSAVLGDGYKTLREGEVVEFETTQGPKGDQAINVTRVGNSDHHNK
jgi:CspA family cold shock protein